ncbi:MAG: DUF4231 domain-containing protein [Terracidiphilus sp.]|jgi:hypothetical protein
MKHIDQITDWYDGAANRYRIGYISVKIFQLFVTASIPVVSLAFRSQPGGLEGLITGTLAAVLLVAEGIQQTLQLLPRWTKYRFAHSALRRERLLFEGTAGPYAQVAAPIALFTERINSIISEENAAWLTIQEQIKQGK